MKKLLIILAVLLGSCEEPTSYTVYVPYDIWEIEPYRGILIPASSPHNWVFADEEELKYLIERWSSEMYALKEYLPDKFHVRWRYDEYDTIIEGLDPPMKIVLESDTSFEIGDVVRHPSGGLGVCYYDFKVIP